MRVVEIFDSMSDFITEAEEALHGVDFDEPCSVTEAVHTLETRIYGMMALLRNLDTHARKN